MLKNKSISGDNSFKSEGESDITFPETPLVDTSNDNITNKKYVMLDSKSISTNKSNTEEIWDFIKSPNQTLRTVYENKKLGVDYRRESLISVSLSSTSVEDDDWSGEEVKKSKIEKRYPLWLCPPFWFINLRGAYRHRAVCIANIILIGSCVYYFVILIFWNGLATITKYLWIASTLVILYTVRQTNTTYTLWKLVSRMIKSFEEGLKIQNELVTNINKLGEEGNRYRLQVVMLMDVIAQTIQANKRLAWRNTQSVKEVEEVDKYITWKKPAMTIGEDEEVQTGKPGKPRAKELSVEVVSSEIKTQGYLVETREGLVSKRGDLNKRIEEERAMLNDVKECIIMLQDYNDNFTNDYYAMKETMNKLQDTVGEVDAQVERLEEFKGLSNISFDADAFSDDSAEYLSMINMKRDRLRKFTFRMEMALVRNLFWKRQHHSGQSGMTRATFNAVIKEAPTSAQRAIKNMGDAGNFDAIRVKSSKEVKTYFGRIRLKSSKKKVMDTKVGRKKLPGIDALGMKDFLLSVEKQMNNDMNKPLKNLIMPNSNTEV